MDLIKSVNQHSLLEGQAMITENKNSSLFEVTSDETPNMSQ